MKTLSRRFDPSATRLTAWLSVLILCLAGAPVLPAEDGPTRRIVSLAPDTVDVTEDAPTEPVPTPEEPVDPAPEEPEPHPGDGYVSPDNNTFSKFLYGMVGAGGIGWLGRRVLPVFLPILNTNPRLKLAATIASGVVGFAGMWMMHKIWKQGGLIDQGPPDEPFIDDTYGYGHTPAMDADPVDDGTDLANGMADIHATE